jgi:para-nitrobenzyl esterase
MPNLKAAEADGLSLAASMKDTSLAQLREIPADKLFYKAIRFFGPIVDGFVLPQTVPETYAAGKQAHVPLLTGWNEDEGLMFSVKTKNEFTSYLQEKYGQDASFLMKFYPARTDAEAAASQVALSRDRLVGLPHYLWASLESASGNPEVYLYNFTRKPPPLNENDRKYGSFHTAEIPYFLDNLKRIDRPWETTDNELEGVMSDYWINFARNGNPNGDDLPLWPAFNTTDKKIMMLNEPPAPGLLPNAGALKFFEEKSGKKDSSP